MPKSKSLSPALPFRALKKTRLFEDVAEQIKQAIFEGQLQPGDRLPSERGLSELFDVGRPTIREALRTLTVLGLVEVRRGQKGSTVKKYNITQYFDEVRKQLSWLIQADNQTLIELWEVRKYLDIGIAHSAAANATKSDFKKLEQLIKKMEACGNDIEAYYPIATEFHQQLGAATKNKIFYMIWEMFHDILLRGYIPILKDLFPEGPKRVLHANKTLFRAIKSGDHQAIDNAINLHTEEEKLFTEVANKSVSRK